MADWAAKRRALYEAWLRAKVAGDEAGTEDAEKKLRAHEARGRWA